MSNKNRIPDHFRQHIHEPIWKLCLTRNVIANHLPAKRTSEECTLHTMLGQISNYRYLFSPTSLEWKSFVEPCKPPNEARTRPHVDITIQHSIRIIPDDKTYNDIIRSNKDLVNCENEKQFSWSSATFNDVVAAWKMKLCPLRYPLSIDSARFERMGTLFAFSIRFTFYFSITICIIPIYCLRDYCIETFG